MRQTELVKEIVRIAEAQSREVEAAQEKDAEPLVRDVTLERHPDGGNQYLAHDVPPGRLERNIALQFGRAKYEAVAHYDRARHGWVIRPRDWVSPTLVTIFPNSAGHAEFLQEMMVRLHVGLSRDGEHSAIGMQIRAAMGEGTLGLGGARYPRPDVCAVQGLSVEQVRAIARLLGGRVSTLIGAPGSGKTSTLAATVVHAAQQGARVVCTAPSNAAADVLHDAIAARALGVPMVTAQRVLAGRSDPLVADRCRVTTVTTALALARMTRDEPRPDVLVIDEASMVGPPTYLSLMLWAAACTIVAGDPWQLPPVVEARDQYEVLGRSALDLTGAVRRLHEKTPRASDVSLLASHRLTPEVVAVLHRGWPETRAIVAVPRVRPPVPRTLGAPLVLFDTAPWLAERRRHRSLSHASLWVSLAERLADEGALLGEPLVVVAPYRHVRDAIRREARTRLANRRSVLIDVRTMHEAQGLTSRIVGVDLLASKPAVRDDGFLGVERPDGMGRQALLVGITRASEVLVIATPYSPTSCAPDTAAGRLLRALPPDVVRIDARDLIRRAAGP